MDEKHKLLGNVEKFLKNFSENSIEKLNFQPFLENYLLVQQKFKKILNRLPMTHLLTRGCESKTGGVGGVKGVLSKALYPTTRVVFNFSRSIFSI